MNQIVDSKNGFEFTFQEDTRDWLYKAVPFIVKNNNKEKPQIEIVNDIEKEYHDSFDKCLRMIGKDIARYLSV